MQILPSRSSLNCKLTPNEPEMILVMSNDFDLIWLVIKNEIKHRQSLLSSHLHAQNSNTMHFKDQPVRLLDRPVHRNLTSNSDLTRCIIPSISNPDFSSPRTSPGMIIWPDSHMTHGMSHLIWLRFEMWSTYIFSKLLNMNRLRMDMVVQVIINHVHLTLDPEHHHHQVLYHQKF